MAVLKMNFLSKYLGMQTNITVCLPSFSFRDLMQGNADYYKPGMQFQTLYLLHGGSGDDSDYLAFSNITRYADEHKIAVVMPSNYNQFYTDNPNGPRYWKYIAEELPEVCQTLFPLSPKREDNFVAGLSMGGFGAMKMGILQGEKFAAALCMSGASINPDKASAFGRGMRDRGGDPDVMPFTNLESLFGSMENFKGSQHDMYAAAQHNVAQGKDLPKFFFTVGDKDFAIEGVEDAYHYLTDIGYDTFYEKVPGYGHEWDFWDLTLKKALAEWLPIKHDPIYLDKE